MLLENATGAVAHLYTVNLLEPELRVAAIIKKTYSLAPDGAVDESPEAVPLVTDQLVTDYGVFHGDIFFRKRGVDICLLATARLAKPVRQTTVRLDVGTWKHELKIVGDRTWVRDRAAGAVASPPAPFQEMPIAYARAYGGAAPSNGAEIPWTDNPGGRGYFERCEDALGKPLPNIEPAAWPSVYAWNARVPVAGWGPYPMYWGLRGSKAVKTDATTGQVVDVSPELFNQAHPELIVEKLDAGTPIRVTGLRASPVGFVLPRERPRLEVHVGAQVTEAWGDLDGFYWWVDAGKFVLTWRARFRYAVRPEEVRRAILRFVEA